MPPRKRQARNVLMTTPVAEEPCDFFDRVCPAPLFWMLGRQVDARLFTHPLLDALEREDGRRNTEYYETMRAYCESFGSKELAVERLCIHRNTLLYRLNRIRERFGFDYADTRELAKLLCSFLLMETLR